MSVKFDVDFNKTLVDIARLSKDIKKVGTGLDSVGSGANKLASIIESQTAKISKHYDNLATGNQKLENTYDRLKFTAEAAVMGIAANHQKAGIQARAWRDSENQLHALLRDTSAI